MCSRSNPTRAPTRGPTVEGGRFSYHPQDRAGDGPAVPRRLSRPPSTIRPPRRPPIPAAPLDDAAPCPVVRRDNHMPRCRRAAERRSEIRGTAEGGRGKSGEARLFSGLVVSFPLPPSAVRLCKRAGGGRRKASAIVGSSGGRPCAFRPPPRAPLPYCKRAGTAELRTYSPKLDAAKIPKSLSPKSPPLAHHADASGGTGVSRKGAEAQRGNS
jgi:hypothetical protein